MPELYDDDSELDLKWPIIAAALAIVGVLLAFDTMFGVLVGGVFAAIAAGLASLHLHLTSQDGEEPVSGPLKVNQDIGRLSRNRRLVAVRSRRG